MIQRILPLFDPCRLDGADLILDASNEHEVCLPDGAHGRFCQRADVPELVRSIGDLRYPERRVAWNSSVTLPETIASVRPGKLLRFAPALLGGVLALKYTDIGGLTKPDLAKVVSWRDRNGIPADTLLVLHQESNDTLLERVFRATRDDRFFRLLTRLGPVVLIAPGYSVYSDGRMCRVHQRINIERSIEFAERAAAFGLTVVPSWGWADEYQRHVHAEWLTENPVPYIALNGQTGASALAEMAVDIPLIEEESDRRHRWIVFGGYRAVKHLVAAGIASERLVHVTTEPFRMALFRRLLHGPRDTVDTPQIELLERNWQVELRTRQSLKQLVGAG